MRKNCLMALIMCFSLLSSFGLASAVVNDEGIVSVTAGSVLDVPLGVVLENPSSSVAGIISTKINGLKEFLEYMGVKIYTKNAEEEVLNYEIFASTIPSPDFALLTRTDLFLESGEITINGVTGNFQTFRTFFMGAGDLGFISSSIQGESLVLVDAGLTPRDYYLFSIY